MKQFLHARLMFTVAVEVLSVSQYTEKQKHVDYLVSDADARAEFITAAATHVFNCSEVAVRVLGSNPVIDGEHAETTSSTSLLCGKVGLERRLECQPTALMYVLHQLSLASAREARFAGCCPKPLLELQRHVVGSWQASSGGHRRRRSRKGHRLMDEAQLAEFPLRLANTLHSLAVSVATGVFERKKAEATPVEEQAGIERYAQFILDGETDGSWEQYLAKAETEAAADAQLAGSSLPGCGNGVRQDDAVAGKVLGKESLQRFDVGQLRAEFQSNQGWVVVPRVLSHPFAEKLRHQLHDMPVEAWHATIWSLKRGQMPAGPTDRPKKIPNIPPHAAAILQGHQDSDIARQNGDFSYHYLRTGADTSHGGENPFANVTIEKTLKKGYANAKQCPYTPGHLVPGALCDLELAMASQRFRAVVSNITGVDVGSRFQDWMASWFRPGDYLTSHADTLIGRRIAFRLGMTPDDEWQDGWGGDLVFENRSLAKGVRLVGSSFNKMLLFDVRSTNMEHYVSEVHKSSAGHKRLAVAGWYE